MTASASPHRRRPGRRTTFTVLGTVVAVTAGVSLVTASADGAPRATGAVPLNTVLPKPAEVQTTAGVAFNLKPDDAVHATKGSGDAKAAADFVAGLLRKPTGYALPVGDLAPGENPRGIVLRLGDTDSVTGPQGYRLDVTAQSVTISANGREGLFNGIETLRQLLPVKVERQQPMDGPWPVQGGHITDAPRYGYRGAMLDVARNFMPVDDVKKYIDDIARYKINNFHLHLADDQGWRLQIKSWPELTTVGASTGVGGVSKGFYTQDQYKEIVQYAWARGITVIPEIDGPDHEQAALASYAELNCDGKAKDLYTGFEKSPDGLLCVDNPKTYEFLDDVIGELAAITPGSYIDVGGDETQNRSQEELDTYYGQVAKIVEKHGKKVMGWQESVGSLTPAKATTEFWSNGINDDQVAAAAKAGAKVVMAPSTHAYVDMKYSDTVPEYPVGNTWAGTTDVKDSYDWQPETQLPGVTDSAITGVEAPVWTETAFGINQVENLAFPRLLSVADIGWSKASAHDWDTYKSRLVAQGPRLREARVNYYLAPELPWPLGS